MIITAMRLPSLFVIAALAITAGGYRILAQTPQGQAETWVINCSGEDTDAGKRCILSQTLVVKETNQRLVSVALRRADKDDGLAMVISLPLGLFLPAGGSFAVDGGKATRFVVQTCDQGGCYAGTKVGGDLLATLKGGSQLKISFQALNKKNIVVPLTLTGFTAALAKYTEMRGE